MSCILNVFEALRPYCGFYGVRSDSRSAPAIGSSGLRSDGGGGTILHAHRWNGHPSQTATGQPR
ncbi:hypothetical protein FH063_001662 [Azospirillum argentinense]|uniref:Uncharacterized protein n=1 Tax=Azospirillum argentinense TaxID=2970906 RepID=A0A5B0L2L4_9PROT|nr:hypothetical protein FH063_001662 [Azospirillum argentinense]